MGCKLRKLDKINYFLPSNWNLLEYSNQSATSISSLFFIPVLDSILEFQSYVFPQYLLGTFQLRSKPNWFKNIYVCLINYRDGIKYGRDRRSKFLGDRRSNFLALGLGMGLGNPILAYCAATGGRDRRPGFSPSQKF